MSDAVRAASVASTDMVAVVQAGGIALATVAQITAEPDARCAALEVAVAILTGRLAADEAAAVLLSRRVAALEGKPDPWVALAGALPVATLQVGTTAVPVPVAGLLASDRVAVQPVSDLPAGLVLAWAHPKGDGLLTVALDALAVLAIKSPIPLQVTALR